MTKAYKNVFDFIYTILGYSPGGTYHNGTVIFNYTNLTTKDLFKLQMAFYEYKSWFNDSDEKEEKRIPDIEFILDFGPTFEEQMIYKNYNPNKIGDTIFWTKI